jgi:uncharacterized protein
MLKIRVSLGQLAIELKDFLSKCISVEHLILFGSYANGSPRADSDIDVIVVSDDFKSMSVFDKISLLANASVAVNSRIELIGVSSKEYEQAQQGSFLNNIKQSGKVLI